MDVGDEGDEWIDINPNGPLEVPEWGCRDRPQRIYEVFDEV
jgi:hypothetical protein